MKTPQPAVPILPCGHREHSDGHCAVMDCRRYVSKCPVHAVAQTGTECNLADRA